MLLIHRNPTRPRGGFSLLEVLMASTLAAIALVSSLALLRDGLQMSRTIDDRLMLTNYAVSELERQLSVVATNWSNGTFGGDYAADGHADFRYTATRSDAVSDGGLVDRLMHVQVTTYIDANGDDALSADEKNCTFRTKIGKFSTYEAL